jgi:hypothetical protein
LNFTISLYFSFYMFFWSRILDRVKLINLTRVVLNYCRLNI